MNRPAIEGGKPIRETDIYYGHQYIDDADIEAVTKVLRSDFLTCGPAIQKAEDKLKEITKAAYAVLCSNGTAALHIAMQAIGAGPGDEVITTPITFAASSNCALYCGARVVFADIDETTYNIDPQKVESLITERTKAVVAVDFTGQAAQLDELLEICHKRGIYLIEDAAHSLGTMYKGRPVGSIADITTMSFHPVKTVTAGEGGAVLTDREDLYRRIALYRTHGITRNAAELEHESHGPWYYEQLLLGMNYRITDIQAALLDSQLDKLSMFAKRRKDIVKRYNEAFGNIPQLIIQREIEESDSVRHLYILRLNRERLSIDRSRFFEAMNAEKIHCNVHYIPVYYFPYYESLGYERGLCPKAEALYEDMLTIPLYYGMSDEDVDSVIEAVKRICAYYAR